MLLLQVSKNKKWKASLSPHTAGPHWHSIQQTHAIIQPGVPVQSEPSHRPAAPPSSSRGFWCRKHCQTTAHESRFLYANTAHPPKAEGWLPPKGAHPASLDTSLSLSPLPTACLTSSSLTLAPGF